MGFTKAPMLLAAAALRSGSTATCGVPGTFSYPYKGVDKRAAVSLLSIAAPPTLVLAATSLTSVSRRLPTGVALAAAPLSHLCRRLPTV